MRRSYSHLCINVTWADAVDLDIVLAPFIAESFGQLTKSTFRCGVCRNRKATLESQE